MGQQASLLNQTVLDDLRVAAKAVTDDYDITDTETEESECAFSVHKWLKEYSLKLKALDTLDSLSSLNDHFAKVIAFEKKIKETYETAARNRVVELIVGKYRSAKGSNAQVESVQKVLKQIQ